MTPGTLFNNIAISPEEVDAKLHLFEVILLKHNYINEEVWHFDPNDRKIRSLAK
jgi:hypothetical protein